MVRIVKFRDGSIPLSDIFAPQRLDIPRWGHGRLTAFYLTGLALNLDDIAFANIAWCGTKGNKYPRTMLDRCFEKNTSRLLSILQPTTILVGGGQVKRFEGQIQKMLANVTIIRTLHYAHRKRSSGRTTGNQRVVEQQEIIRIKKALKRARVETD
jgi:hypothetical protein